MKNLFRKNRIKNYNSFVEPDEIFLDSKNLENFDNQQFEGRIEKTISKKVFFSLISIFIVVISFFILRLQNLQIKNGELFLKRSENNTLIKTTIFAERGIIYDRNMKEMAWNKNKMDLNSKDDLQKLNIENENQNLLNIERTGLSNGFSHLLGYVNYPTKDSSGKYWQTEFVGKSGLEKEYNDKINGINGSKVVEMDAQGNIHSQNLLFLPKRGEDLVTSIDSRIQNKVFLLIKDLVQKSNYEGGAGVIMDVRNGEIITSTSYPEYDLEIMSYGKDKEKINFYLTDKRKIFLDKVISGLYTPGSIVKPILALGALNEGIISPEKKILSTGSISLPNPYFKDKKNIFKDWKAHGWTDMREAIAVSSDVYFYSIGGGYKDQKGLGIINIEKYAKLFGIEEKTGIDIPNEKSGNIPNPEWKIKNFKGDPWRIGDTYHTSIGQYGFQVTPLEMVRAIGAIANNGKLVSPHFLLNDKTKEKSINLNLRLEDLKVVKEGMRLTTKIGTASNLNLPYLELGAKTGTAQLGVAKNRVNSWIVGFFPYENPKYAFVILMESAPSSGYTNASTVMRGLFDWMNENTKEYF